MKRFLALLCVMTILLTMIVLAGCTDDEKGNPNSDDPQTEQGDDGNEKNSDDSVVNQDNTQNDDYAADIFGPE